jgi:hypothetical protein
MLFLRIPSSGATPIAERSFLSLFLVMPNEASDLFLRLSALRTDNLNYFGWRTMIPTMIGLEFLFEIIWIVV